jgi:pimeloyl-ACP methyl ester carboxylesterase
MPFVESVDGVKVFYEALGEGDTPIIIAPGLGAWDCKEAWKGQLYLAEEYKLVLLDLPGHAQSGKNRKKFTMELFGQDIKAIAEELDLTNIILVGYSLGGAVIVEAAKLIPERVKGLLCVDTLLFPMYLEQFNEENVEKTMKPFEEDFDTAYNGLINQYITDEFDPEALKILRDSVPTLDKPSIKNILAEIFRWKGKEVMKTITTPMKFIFADRTIPAGETRDKIIESYDAEFLDGVGHLMVLEKPEAFNEILERKIKEFIS